MADNIPGRKERNPSLVLSYARMDDLDNPGIAGQQLDVMGTITHRFFNAANAAFEKDIREKLIELGWTPPPEKPAG